MRARDMIIITLRTRPIRPVGFSQSRSFYLPRHHSSSGDVFPCSVLNFVRELRPTSTTGKDNKSYNTVISLIGILLIGRVYLFSNVFFLDDLPKLQK